MISGEHVPALLQLLRHGDSPVLELAARNCSGSSTVHSRLVYKLRAPLQVRRKVRLCPAKQQLATGQPHLDPLTPHLVYTGEGACVEVRASGVQLSGMSLQGSQASLRVHNRMAGVEVNGCQLLGTVGVKKDASVSLRDCIVRQGGVSGGWPIYHAISVEGKLHVENCRISGAGARGVNARSVHGRRRRRR